MLQGLFIGKAKNTRVEFLRFLPVGGVTSVIDFGILIILTEHFEVHYLLSAAVGFLAGQVWSYFMCVNWVFATCSVDGHTTRFGTFLLISMVGLAITEFFLWYFTEIAGLYYLLSKIIASAVAFLLLFFIRKKVLFS
ncbi:MAG TPA: GtrA family protein [Candidatus Paceibacterota bacterium]